MNIYINNIAKWKVSRYDYLDPQMGLRSISLTINHPSNWIDGDAVEVADFTDAYVMYKGEKFKLSISKPTAEKKNSTLDYEYRLVFKGSEDELTRRKVRDLAEVGVNKYISQGTSFSLSASIQQFKQLLDNNLRYYFGNDWDVVIAGDSQDSARIDINNTSIWELLQKTYEYYGLRWNIKNKTITIGYEPVLIDHVFDYGKEGGLVKITRTAQDDSTPNRITGTGGSRNLPKNYFTNRYSDFRPDPDVISDSVNIKNLMPKVFRDSVRSGTLPYIDYVEDEQLVALNGVIEDALAPNEDIYPSIAGVEVTGLGRIDEIIYSDIPLYNRPEEDEITEWDEEGNPITPADNYSPTFDIWVKDIGFDLADEKYTSTEDAKISFTTGDLVGYEFTILSKGKRKEGDIVKDKEVYHDTSKSHGGVNSAYKITLIKSDEDFDATNRMLPNTVFYPRAGDSFVIYNIEMPQSYVENAELRLQRWLEAQLEELKTEKPTYAIEIMPSFFKTAELEFDGVSIEDKLEAGNLIRVMNASVTGEMQTLHINNLTVEYKDLLPKYRFTVTDKVSVDGNAVGRLQSQLDAVISRQLLTEKEIDAILSGFSTKFLSKVRPDIAQEEITFKNGLISNALSKFLKGIVTKNIKSPIFAPGLLGEGFIIDENGNAVLESLELRTSLSVPEIRFNRTTVYTGIRWDTFGAGKIKNVTIDTDANGDKLQSGIIELELEAGEFGAIAVDDMAMGVFHNFASSNDTIAEDQKNGNFRFKGFSTVYFRITEILESDNSRFRYVLRGVSEKWKQQNHPHPYMHFACYANPSNTDRQSSSYTTTDYSIRLKNMTTWEYGNNNIYEISGKLDGFQIGETILEGEGQAFGNAYIWGTLQKVYNDPVRMEINNGGDGFLALGETMVITCRVMRGWEDITDTVETWTVTRETGNQVEDTAWNIAHQNFNGVLQLTHTKQQTDLGSGLTTLFVFTAKAGKITASFHLTI